MTKTMEERMKVIESRVKALESELFALKRGGGDGSRHINDGGWFD
jgi:hypothetical protein